MKRRIRFIIKSILFLSVLGIVVSGVNHVLTLKYMYNTREPMTYTIQGFYQMEPNTVDVLFLGSSQAATAFNPQDLYNYYGITSYNLSSPGQVLWVSYYWLQEALQYQSPKAVILDCYMLFFEPKKYEEQARQALDGMRQGPVKWEAVKTVCSFDESQSVLSYWAPNIRFHGRWEKGLNEGDFLWQKANESSTLKGFWLYTDMYINSERYEENSSDVIEDSENDLFLPDAEEYLNKIVELCRENNIELILVKTPIPVMTTGMHNNIMNYAKEQGIRFYDFNEKKICDEINFNYMYDMNDSMAANNGNAHANFSGARKMIQYIGDILQNEYGVEGKVDWQWESTKEFGEDIWDGFQLHNETDLSKYISMLGNNRYTVFIAAMGTNVLPRSEEMQAKLSSLGLDMVGIENAYNGGYIAVIEGEKVIVEQTDGAEKMYQMSSFRNGSVIYEIMSDGYDVKCSIKINGGEQAVQQQGLNIVVYDNELKMVVDSVSFDINQSEPQVIR